MSLAGLAGLFLALLVVHEAAAAPTEPPPELAVTLEYARASCSEDGIGFSVTLGLHVRVTNSSGRTLILARKLEAAPWYRLAASAEDARLDTFVNEFDGYELWPGDVKRPNFGPQPDMERFVLLQPGDHSESIVETGVLATDVSGGMPGFVTAGPTYAFQTVIRTWPFQPMSDTDIESIAKRWRKRGDLARAPIETPFIDVVIPREPEQCSSH